MSVAVGVYEDVAAQNLEELREEVEERNVELKHMKLFT